jgi:hypothetical protein
MSDMIKAMTKVDDGLVIDLSPARQAARDYRGAHPGRDAIPRSEHPRVSLHNLAMAGPLCSIPSNCLRHTL